MNTTPKILIVEDNAIVAADIKARIQKMGYQVTDCVAKGESAVESVKIVPPDLILMDIKLKGEMNGIEAASSIRTRDDIPIIFITSYSDEKTIERAKNTDPFGYIVKPFEDKELHIVIELAIHKHTLGRRLKESEQWFKTTLTCIGDGVITTDMQGMVTFMNPVAENLTGWSLVEAQGLPISDVFHIVNEYTELMVENPVTRAIETGQVLGLANHTLLIAKDGRKRSIKDSGAPIILDTEDTIGVVLVFQDNSEARTAEKKLQASEEKFRALFDYAPLPYQSLDVNGNFLDVNQTWLQLMGYKKKEVEGKFFGDFLKSEWQQHFAVNFPLFKSIGEVLGVEFEMKRKDGTFITAQFDGKISSDSGGNFLQTHCVFRDITEEMRLKKLLKEQEKMLRQQQKMEAIGTLTGGIAHNFNNILSTIIGFTELSLEDVAEGTELQDNLKEIFSASFRAKNLVDQLLTFSKEEEGEKQIIDVRSFVSDVIKMLRTTLPSSIELIKITGDHSIKIAVNTAQLRQVLMNIVTNGVQAIAANGTITIGVENVQIAENGPQYGEAPSPGAYAKISIRDTGTGIAEEHIHQIFDPYFTTKSPEKGSGLGLSVVHGIISSHGGHITVSSEAGIGTDFSLYLPLISQPDTPSVAQAMEPLPGGSERILVVDDDPKIAKLLQRNLGRLGYEVTFDLGSIDALERFRQHPDTFDLVLTDMTMPSMTGLQLAEKIKRIRADIPVLLCTGYSDEINQEGPLPAQLDGLLMKPVENSQLISKIRELLDAKQ